MNLEILLKVLTALTNVTDLTGTAYTLKSQLEMLAKDPDSYLQISQLIMGSVCNDYATFEQVGQFVALCLTQGQADRMPGAVAQFQQMAQKVV